MTQETRKDPRAKVLTMTVRYKSATLDEFIEHHSHDVSRGGMFIKTPSPFPPGTLLKFEVKIAGEQRVMQGVGRVVWKRESSEVSDARPAGMGVKFIKIDDESRKVIDQLVSARGDTASTFEQGSGEPARGPGPAPREINTQVVAPSLAAREAPPTSNKPRKATMLGLGSMQGEPETAQAVAAEAFFPPADAEQPQPLPEDRTVMKQAAELLKDALREAGGSLDEVGAAEAAKQEPRTEPPPAISAAPESRAESIPPASAKVSEKPAASERSVVINARPGDEVTQPARRASAPASPAARRTSEPPRSRSEALKESSNFSDSGGGGRFVLAAVAIAAAGLVVYFLSKPKPEAPSAPEPPVPAAEAPPAAEPPAPAAPTAEPPPAASAEATGAPSAAAPPAASVEPAPAAAPSAAPVSPSAPAAAAPAPAPKPQPVAPRPAPKKPAPKPASEAPAAEAPAEKPPAEAPAAPPAPAEAKPPEPAAPKPEAPKAPAAPKGDDSGDNPY